MSWLSIRKEGPMELTAPCGDVPPQEAHLDTLAEAVSFPEQTEASGTSVEQSGWRGREGMLEGCLLHVFPGGCMDLTSSLALFRP